MPTRPLSSTQVTQIGIIVRDVEAAARRWAALLGVPVPEARITGVSAETKMTYRGAPSEGRAKLAFFTLGSVSLELIEPVGGPSTWRDFLDRRGEGVHHLAFQVKDTEDEGDVLAGHGVPRVQSGEWGTGRYAYHEDSLGVAIELLQHF
jgi:methylmalonyl-CoA/ethylmalonyl-CoA epimerase